jgi:hypothetical protein
MSHTKDPAVDDAIAALEVTIDRSGATTPGAVYVGRPRMVEGGTEFRCEVFVQGLQKQPTVVRGSDGLQALILGLLYLSSLLKQFVGNGGRLRFREGQRAGDEVPLNAYFEQLGSREETET